ncbi:MAG: DUF6288 domain-containing protein [Akkermansiaceae bacterium]|nr:DUF6288 domain-containing protein [Akkermansiaceae bacterium]
MAGKKVKMPDAEPDYTKGEKPVTTKNAWNLGPIGAFGDLWTGSGSDDATRKTRMIHINSVQKGSPAEGVLESGDVILGVLSPKLGEPAIRDGRFNDDVRHVLAAAITQAEAEKNGGKLVLNIWRKGKAMPVTVQLPVLGKFSDTTPYECEKTRRLIEQTAQAILEEGFYQVAARGEDKGEVTGNPRNGIPDYLNALGLLATADKQFLPVVQKYARDVAKGSERLDIYGGKDAQLGTWHAAYRNLFLTEYFLATRDEEVLAGIKALSMYLSLGQSGVGTWSHGMAAVAQNGLYGPPSAYGSMNSASVPCGISLILAQKCGIDEKPINDAVVRTLDFFRWYTDKGCPPYGDHAPKLDHDNNGKGSMTAVLFDIAGEEEPARFFTRSTLASYNTRESGHTGNFFSMTWGATGAARGGPEAANSFVENTLWMTELERRHDGSYVYQYQLPSDTKKYNNWSTSGIRLMQHCLPRKAIYLTGKGGCLPAMDAREVAMCEAAAVYDPSGKTINELLGDLSSWSPVVRNRAAEEIGKREDKVVDELIALLNSPDRYAGYGACRGLYYAGRESEKAVDALIAQIKGSDDLTMRYYAVEALKNRAGGGRRGPGNNGLGKAVLRAADALLIQAATYEPKKDPMRKLHNHIASVLFYEGRVADYRGYFNNGKGLDKVDRKILIPAIKSLLVNPNGGARTSASDMFEYLSEEDLEQLYGDVYVATARKAPSGVMFGKGMYKNGAILLSNKRFKEALPLAMDLLYEEGWGTFSRGPAAMEALTNFGSEVKPLMDRIEPKYQEFLKHSGINNKKLTAIWEEIQANQDQKVDLRSIRPYLEASGIDPSILESK